MSRLQKSVALSITKAEYMAISETVKDLTLLKIFFAKLDKEQLDCILFCNNQSVIHMLKNPMFNARTKHI